ncbi:U-box domain-containing protein 19-like [Argentina anserina]|uniref:U-box domain-containing protein 19-like n=1 Tax=Argentina anserina TaxID=57926 RepID=UPI0021765314|nr:U-box domain-containing protein 19-like [Potentilla anserina]
MIKHFDRSDRRILKFPAVNPCQGASPATLLVSLTILSRKILDFQSVCFATQKRNCRETIRQISLLHIFFEELCTSEPVLSDSVSLSFSELHLAYQKIWFLLADCSREGARLWMLTKCEFLATQFRVLIRAISTDLDVLPLSLIDVEDEVKEMVELVRRQSRKAKFELDASDRNAKKLVLSILDQFEKGIEPDSGEVKRVLDYLGIRSWTHCNMEIKFLEEEIAFEYSESDEREVPFLSSLVGFLTYCRGVIFEKSDNGNLDETQAEFTSNMEVFTCLNTEDFRCPISLEVMLDPVIVSTGQTYDRSSIQKWLEGGNMLCPKTGEKLMKTDLVPNLILRKLIRNFCAYNGVSLGWLGKQSRDITRTTVPDSQVASESMKFLSMYLTSRLAFGTSEQRNKAAYEIRLLAKSNIFNRSCLINAGAVPCLLNLLCFTGSCTQENAMAALLKLSKYGSGKRLIVEGRGLNSILAVLKHGLTWEARQSAAATIFYLSSVKEYRKLIGETPGAIQGLVDLMKEGTPCGKKNAVVAIFGLLLSPKNHHRVLEAGTVPLLVDILASSEKVELLSDTLAVISLLSENTEGAFAILSATSLSLITGILQSSTSQTAKEHCVATLLALCINGGAEVVGLLAKNQSLMASLFSLLTEGTSNAGKKSRALIKILQSFHETSSSGWILSSAVPCELAIYRR